MKYNIIQEVIGPVISNRPSAYTGSGRGGPDPAFPPLFRENPTSPTFFISFPNTAFFSQKNTLKLINVRCRLILSIDILNLRVFLKVSGIPDRHANINPASRAQFLASPASRGTVKSRIPSIYLSFSRCPHRILVKSRIPKIPFQTLRIRSARPI